MKRAVAVHDGAACEAEPDAKRAKTVEDGQEKSVLELEDKQFECVVCFDLLVDPVVSKCGHDFCKGCLEDWHYQQHKEHWQRQPRLVTPTTCPVCRKDVGIDSNCPAPHDELGVCIRLKDLIERLFPRRSQQRRKEVEEQDKERKKNREQHDSTARRTYLHQAAQMFNGIAAHHPPGHWNLNANIASLQQHISRLRQDVQQRTAAGATSGRAPQARDPPSLRNAAEDGPAGLPQFGWDRDTSGQPTGLERSIVAAQLRYNQHMRRDLQEQQRHMAHHAEEVRARLLHARRVAAGDAAPPPASGRHRSAAAVAEGTAVVEVGQAAGESTGQPRGGETSAMLDRAAGRVRRRGLFVLDDSPVDFFPEMPEIDVDGDERDFIFGAHVAAPVAATTLAPAVPPPAAAVPDDVRVAGNEAPGQLRPAVRRIFPLPEQGSVPPADAAADRHGSSNAHELAVHLGSAEAAEDRHQRFRAGTRRNASQLRPIHDHYLNVMPPPSRRVVPQQVQQGGDDDRSASLLMPLVREHVLGDRSAEDAGDSDTAEEVLRRSRAVAAAAAQHSTAAQRMRQQVHFNIDNARGAAPHPEAGDGDADTTDVVSGGHSAAGQLVVEHIRALRRARFDAERLGRTVATNVHAAEVAPPAATFAAYDSLAPACLASRREYLSMAPSAVDHTGVVRIQGGASEQQARIAAEIRLEDDVLADVIGYVQHTSGALESLDRQHAADLQAHIGPDRPTPPAAAAAEATGEVAATTANAVRQSGIYAATIDTVEAIIDGRLPVGSLAEDHVAAPAESTAAAAAHTGGVGNVVRHGRAAIRGRGVRGRGRHPAVTWRAVLPAAVAVDTATSGAAVARRVAAERAQQRRDAPRPGDAEQIPAAATAAVGVAPVVPARETTDNPPHKPNTRSGSHPAGAAATSTPAAAEAPAGRAADASTLQSAASTELADQVARAVGQHIRRQMRSLLMHAPAVVVDGGYVSSDTDEA